MKTHSRSKAPPYLVVGAGAQGLTFALALAERGLPVVLIERSGRVGGFARSICSRCALTTSAHDTSFPRIAAASDRAERNVRSVMLSPSSYYTARTIHWPLPRPPGVRNNCDLDYRSFIHPLTRKRRTACALLPYSPPVC